MDVTSAGQFKATLALIGRRSRAQPGTARFALATVIPAALALRYVVAIPFVAIPVFAGQDPGPLGAVHPFVFDIARWSAWTAAAWLIRSRSPSLAWLVLLWGFFDLAPPAMTLMEDGFLYAAVATVATLYASEPGRRLGRWVGPVGAVIAAGCWAGAVAFVPFRAGFEGWWIPLIEIPHTGIHLVPAALGIAGEIRRIWPMIRRAFAEDRPSHRARTSRWMRAGLVTTAIALVYAVAASLVFLSYVRVDPVAGTSDQGWAVTVGAAATSGLLVALLFRVRFPALAWWAMAASAFADSILLGSSAVVSLSSRAFPHDLAIRAAIGLAVAIALALAISGLYASDPTRRLGRWVPPCAIVLILWASVGFTVGSAALIEGSSAPWWAEILASRGMDLTGSVLFLQLLGLAGDLRHPVGRAVERIRADRTSPRGWIGAVASELNPSVRNASRAAAESERARLASDLHAQLIPSLNLALAAATAGGASFAVAERLRMLEADIRDLVAERRHVILEELGIVPALEWLVERGEERSRVTVTLVVADETTDARPPVEVERAAFRVTQLALDNALLHARPTEVTVEVLAQPRQLRVVVRDDGVGIDGTEVADQAAANHLGMSDMRLQAELVHARVAVTAGQSPGTTVTFEWVAR